MKILVTGISGYVGSMVAPALTEAGHEVRGIARDLARVAPALRSSTLTGDVSTGEGLPAALDGVEVAYYLIHAMEGNADFRARERADAERFARAAAEAGVRRVIYMSVLAPRTGARSAHVESRTTVEQVFAAQVPEVLVLRASIVIGARSRSFAFLLSLVERMPVIPLGPWRNRRTAPIDERDLLRMLVAAAEAPLAGESPVVVDATGPATVTYSELIDLIADELLVSRPQVPLPAHLLDISAPVAAAISGEDLGLVAPLMASLTEDLLPGPPTDAISLPAPRRTLRSAVAHALLGSDLPTPED